MKKDSGFHLGRNKIVFRVFIVVILVIVSYVVIVYGMLRMQLEDFRTHNLEYGLSYYYNIQDYKEAEKYFKTALFLEKYIIFWDNHEKLPLCYACLALVQRISPTVSSGKMILRQESSLVIVRNVPCYKCTECNETIYTADVIVPASSVNTSVYCSFRSLTMTRSE